MQKGLNLHLMAHQRHKGYILPVRGKPITMKDRQCEPYTDVHKARAACFLQSNKYIL